MGQSNKQETQKCIFILNSREIHTLDIKLSTYAELYTELQKQFPNIAYVDLFCENYFNKNEHHWIRLDTSSILPNCDSLFQLRTHNEYLFSDLLERAISKYKKIPQKQDLHVHLATAASEFSWRLLFSHKNELGVQVRKVLTNNDYSDDEIERYMKDLDTNLMCGAGISNKEFAIAYGERRNILKLRSIALGDTFRDFATKFSLFVAIFDAIKNPTFREEMIVATCENYHNENVSYVEFSVSIGSVLKGSNEYISAAKRALNECGVTVRYLIETHRDQVEAQTVLRKKGKLQNIDLSNLNLPAVCQTLLCSQLKKNISENICNELDSLLSDEDFRKYFIGFDLVGEERRIGIPMVTTTLLPIMKKHNLCARIHLGEQNEVDLNVIRAGFAAFQIFKDNNIPYAVGHGLKLLDAIEQLSRGEGAFADKEYLINLLREAVRIEICPFSNLFINSSKHPLEMAQHINQFIDYVTVMKDLNLPLVLGTDNATLFDQTLLQKFGASNGPDVLFMSKWYVTSWVSVQYAIMDLFDVQIDPEQYGFNEPDTPPFPLVEPQRCRGNPAEEVIIAGMSHQKRI